MAKILHRMDPPTLVTGPWKLANLRTGKLGSPKNGLKVFSCFHCGGGSTMGYKLAGFDVVGGIEIDSDMMKLYRKNHSPREDLSLLMPIQDFPAMQTPKELMNIDVLDGSPPCSSFSTSGSRDEGWNEKRLFREGQTEQVLDDLFFHFIKVADILKPKMVIAENVKGLIVGLAKGYVRDIFRAYDKAGYDTQLFLLNSSLMGVPQMRERTFFISRRRDLGIPKLDLSFNEKPITVGEALKGTTPDGAKELTGVVREWWKRVPRGKRIADVHPKKHMWDLRKSGPEVVSHTITATNTPMHWDSPRFMSPSEVLRLQSFPDDYDFLDQSAGYVCGMSVPPLMMQRVATEVAKALLANRAVSSRRPKPSQSETQAP